MSFSPASIPNLAFWLDASDASTFVFSSGSNVSRWIDKSPYANDLIQPIVAKQPEYTTTPGGYPGVYFSTIADRLYSIANAAMSGNSSRTLFAVLHAPTPSSVFILGTGTNAPAAPPTAFGIDLNPAVGTIWHPYVYNESDIRSLATVTDLVPLYAYYDSTTSTLGGGYNFGNVQTRTATLNTTPSNWFLGERFFDGVGSVNAYCCEVIHYEGILTPAQLRQVELYLGLKWGISYSLLPPALLVNGSLIGGTTTQLSLFKYEPFSYTYTPTGGETLTLILASTLIRSLVSTVGSSIVFASTGYTGSVSTSEQIIFQSSPSGIVYTVNITLSAGRFTSPTLTAFSFNKNTSVETTYGSNIVFTTAIPITTPITTPILPPGLSFVQIDSRNYILTGTPQVVTPTQAFTVYGFGTPNTSQVVTKAITIIVNGEVITLNIDGGSNATVLNVDVPIGDRSITAVYPLSAAGNLAYTWSNLPDGLSFTDYLGNPQTSPFYPVDGNSTMTLVGNPTLAAAQQFVASGSSNRTVRVRATRLSPTPLIADLSLNLTFAPTVLFTSTSNISIYAGETINPGQVAITARTFFDPLNTPIALITAPELPAGVSLSYTSGSSNAFLAGTPISSGSNTYTFTADNSNGVTRDTSINIVVSNDVTFFSGLSPSNDVCYNFVISRPLDQALTGYYPAPIQYSASAVSGSPVTLSITNLPVGVTANVSGNTLTLSGIPTTITGLTTSVITAIAADTGVDVSRALNWAVLNDVFTVTSPTTLATSNYTYIQNRNINPIQFQATTLSGRSVSFWTPCNSGIYAVPAGLSLSAQGRLTGAPSSFTTPQLDGSFKVETFRVIASTGYTTGVVDVCYNIVQEYILTGFESGQSVTTPEVFSNVEMYALPYSGRTEPVTLQVKNNSLRYLPSSNSPTLSLTNNILSGNFTTANPLFPTYYFDVCASFLGQSLALGSVRVSVSNPDSTITIAPVSKLISNERFPTMGDPTYSPSIGTLAVINTKRFAIKAVLVGDISGDFYTWNPSTFETDGILGAPDFCDANVSATGVAVAVAGERVYRSTDGGDTFLEYSTSNIGTIPGLTGYFYSNVTYGRFSGEIPYMAAVATDNSSNWVCVGRGYTDGGNQRGVLRLSTDDGLTWNDSFTSTGLPFVSADSRTKLHYNNGRYFLTQLAKAGVDGYYYADAAVDITVWNSGGIFQTGAAYAFAANGNVVMMGGEADGLANTLYISSNNGNTWTPLTNPYGGTTTIFDLAYGDGKWVIYGSNVRKYSTNNGSTWSDLLTSTGSSETITATFMNNVYDKSGWLAVWANVTSTAEEDIFLNGVNPATMRSFDPFTSMLNYAFGGAEMPSVYTTNYSMKRLVSTVIRSPGTGTLTLTAGAERSTTTFIAPTQRAFTLYQYCSISPITIDVSSSSRYVYYWARNLPRGLSLSFPDPADGDPATIVGVPSQYNDGFQRVQIHAVTSLGEQANGEIDMRVILPYVMKKQDGASGYTAWLRQYVNVNGAQNARDSVVLPTQVQSLGQFTSPGVPNVITDSNCPC